MEKHKSSLDSTTERETNDSDSEDVEEDLFEPDTLSNEQERNILEDLQISYNNRPHIYDLTFPHKFYPKKKVNTDHEMPAEISHLPVEIPEEHFPLFTLDTLFYIF